jgi:hypothetical protein
VDPREKVDVEAENRRVLEGSRELWGSLEASGWRAALKD